jgi:mono/diheme cytochrome c family protein
MTTWKQVILRSLGVAVAVSLLSSAASAQSKSAPFKPAIPKTWDDKALADWATPVAGLNVRPGHFSEAEYYRAPLNNYRTYPVYAYGREPEGYWDMLQKVGPKPLIEVAKLKTEADWIEAGRQVFEELDHFTQRIYDPDLIAILRSPENSRSTPSGFITPFRWVPTEKGIAIGRSNCGSCHTRYGPEGKRLNGPAILNAGSPGESADRAAAGTARRLGMGPFVSRSYQIANAPIRMMEPLGARFYRAFGVPWIQDDIHEHLKEMSPEELAPIAVGFVPRNPVFPRWNGSPYYPTKIPDLIGVKDRKYLDATGTHLNRGIGDLMRYAALVSFAESSEFGPHRLLTPQQNKIEARLPDEALYALSLYIQSLQPPPNPNAFDENAAAGKKIFQREGCGGCHTPGLYTNNKLTLATGFKPPADKPSTLDVLPVSVGTDSNLALKTRKGTGYYKVPSLKGVWYRGRYLHDGSLGSLEEMFDPDRLKETHVAGGWNPGGTPRATIGHEFGLKLTPDEKKSLLAFLRTL